MRQNANFAVLLACSGAYALMSIFAQIEFPTLPGTRFSPFELALWLALFFAVVVTIRRLTALDGDDKRRKWWTIAAVTVIALTVIRSADWYADWYIDLVPGNSALPTVTLNTTLNTTLAIMVAASLFWLGKVPRQYAWLRRCLKAMVAFQILAIIAELAEPGCLLGALPDSRQLSFTTEFAELLCIEFYLVGLALSNDIAATRMARALPQLLNSRKGSFVGANARLVYHACNLYNGAKHPPVPLSFYPGFSRLTLYVFLIYFLAVSGPVVKRSTGKSLLKQAQEMHALWTHQGIDPPTYYAQELYRPERSQDAPHYLTRYETKNGLLWALNNRTRNPYPFNEMKDKQRFAEICARNHIPFPQTLASASDGHVHLLCKPAQLHTSLFCKRQLGMGAMGTMTFAYQPDGTYLDEEGTVLQPQEMLQAIADASKDHALLVQPWLQNHHAIADLAKDSLVTMRVVTWINEAGQPEVTMAMMRVLAKLEPQWPDAPDEEYGAPIDLDTGEMGLLTGDNFKTLPLRYETHLITGAPVAGRVLEQWPAIKDVALRAHKAFANRLLVGWDIALTEQGPVVLEGNTNLDVMFLQRVQNKPASLSRFGEIMNFQLRELYKSRRAA